MTKQIGFIAAAIALSSIASTTMAQAPKPHPAGAPPAGTRKADPSREQLREQLAAARKDVQRDQAQVEKLTADLKSARERNDADEIKRDQEALKHARTDLKADREKIKDLQAQLGKT